MTTEDDTHSEPDKRTRQGIWSMASHRLRAADVGDDPAKGVEKLAAGFASGIGGVGLVVFTGGALQWLRFRAAHLPADQAVAAVPKNELIATGAGALAWFLLFGGAVVLVAYLCDPKGRPLSALLVAGAMSIVGLGYAIIFTDMKVTSILILVGVAVVLTGMGVAVAARTKGQFLWLGAGLFAAVVIFGSVMQYLTNSDDPQVQPVAIIRGPNDEGLVGVYVALGDKRLYVKQVEREGYRPGLYVFPCAAVSSIAIGQFQDPGPAGADAFASGEYLLEQLKDAQNRVGRQSKKSRNHAGVEAESQLAPATTAGIC
jgi:hypothetical protein